MYLYPQLRILIQASYFGDELNYLILNWKQQYYAMLISLQICVGKEFMKAIPLFHALTYSSISISEISCKYVLGSYANKASSSNLNCMSCWALLERGRTPSAAIVLSTNWQWHHPLHSSLGWSVGLIMNSQGFLHALFQTIDKKNMLKFGERGKKKKSDSNITR